MNGRERVRAAIYRTGLDRVPMADSYWEDTLIRWQGEGLAAGADPVEHFDFDIAFMSLDPSPRYPVELMSETDTTRTFRDRFGYVVTKSRDKSRTVDFHSHAIDDRARQGGFFDKGFERTPEYKGIRDIPAGYWVYLAPSWYVWEEVHPLPLEAPDEARMQGKYDRLLRVIPAPDEAAKHATLDGGRRTTKAYKGVVDIPPGYWVYTAPNWYVWGVSNEAEPPPKEEKKTATSKTPVKKRGLVPPPKKKAQ